MKKIEDIFVFVQSRLNSERIPGKMLAPFAGTTLLEIAIKKILQSNVIPKENFHLSVAEEELKSVGQAYGVNIFERSEKSSLAEESMTDMYEWHDKVPYTYAIKINACLPFLSIETIDNFVRHYLNSPHDGLFAVMEKKSYFWNSRGEMITTPPERGKFMNTKLVEPTYEAAHCLYASRVDHIKEGIWMGSFTQPNDPELFAIEEREAFDIDYPWQFSLAENLYHHEITKST